MIDLIWSVLRWWLVLALLGLAGLPMARRLLGSLPDRGLAFARPIGLLACGLLYWLGGMAGILPNNLLGAGLAALLVLGAGLWLARDEGLDPRSWWQENKRLFLGYELLFGLTFLLWALYRAFHPAIETSGGEKYMEMAFISGILESPGLPPVDPWLSGGTISYYYFGYLMASILTRLSMVPRFEAFNLLVPMTLGLTLVAACGIGWNLARLAGAARRGAAWLTGLATGLLLAIMGSLEGFLELAYIRAWLPDRYFDFLAIKNLGVSSQVCGESNIGHAAGGWVPQRFIWWWRGSRVITDIDPATGGCREVIHEFPFFSFMLGDAHPHVLTLPFALLVLALALAVLAGGFDLERERQLLSPRFLALPVAVGALGFLNTWDLPTYGFVLVCAWFLRGLAIPAAELPFEDDAFNRASLLLGGLGLGAFGWRASTGLLGALRDLPPESLTAGSKALVALAAVLAGGMLIQSLQMAWRGGQAWAGRLLDGLRFAVWLGALSILFYLPFYLSFSSQASGFGLVDVRSRLAQWLVHFGPLVWLAFGLVAWQLARLQGSGRGLSRPALWIAAPFGLVALVALWLTAWTALVLAIGCGLAGALALQRVWSATEGIRELDLARASEASEAEAEPVEEDAVDATFEATVDATGTEQPAVASTTVTTVTTGASESTTGAESGLSGFPPAPRLPGPTVAASFALLCLAVGLLMPLGTEFVFLRDLFGSRMNSIFKLYYQAWTLLAVGGGYAAFALWRGLRPPARWAWALPTALLVAGGLVFTLMAVHTRTSGFSAPQGLSLDGLRWWVDTHPADLEVAAWLQAHTPRGTVILEAHAPGGYSHNGRIAMASGRPAVLGWSGHQHQWRGSQALGMLGERQGDIEALYGPINDERARQLLNEYRVDYAVIGVTERGMGFYDPSAEDRFARMWTRVFTSSDGQAHIYARRADTSN